MFLNWIVKMSTQVAVLCVIEPLIVTGRLLLLFQRYLVHKFSWGYLRKPGGL